MTRTTKTDLIAALGRDSTSADEGNPTGGLSPSSRISSSGSASGAPRYNVTDTAGGNARVIQSHKNDTARADSQDSAQPAQPFHEAPRNDRTLCIRRVRVGGGLILDTADGPVQIEIRDGRSNKNSVEVAVLAPRSVDITQRWSVS